MALTRLGLNQSVNLASNVTGTLPTANGGTGATSFSPGKVLQVIQGVKTDTFSNSGSTYTDITGLSASITPSSTSNKVLVMVDAKTSCSSGNHYINLLRGSTGIYESSDIGSRTQSIGYGNQINIYDQRVTVAIFLDSPSTTSATTYKCQVRAESSGTVYLNRSSDDRNTANADGRHASSITLYEIAG